MPEEQPDPMLAEELKKLSSIATDLQMSSKMRFQAINTLGDMGSHESLLVLLNLAANDRLNIDERDLALKRAREIVKKEGIFVGMSSGAAMYAALEVAKKIDHGNIVVIFPDRGEKYLSTELFEA